jgi:hypothetical protein
MAEMRATILTLAAWLGMSLQALAAPPPTVTNAVDGILAAFRMHPVVGLGEIHNWAQELDFYTVLLRDPRFAREVGNIVLEIGDAAQQETVDRYVNGENVPYAALRKVWSDNVGWFATVTPVGSINLYPVIREVNLKLPPEDRIKVWLGEPPIDWAQIKTKADWDPIEAQRDSYPADLIVREILSKNKKALVIYGTNHFGIFPGRDNIRALLDRTHPRAFFVVSPFVGYADKTCASQLGKFSRHLAVPSLLTPVRGSSLEKDIYWQGCAAFLRPAGMADAEYQAQIKNDVGLNGDALLYLGSRNQMMQGPQSPDVYLDLDFRTELERRWELRLGKRKDLTPADNQATPRSFWKN